jgi:hypothetical protein
MKTNFPITAIVQKGKAKLFAEAYGDGPDVTPAGSKPIETKPGSYLFNNSPKYLMEEKGGKSCGCGATKK